MTETTAISPAGWKYWQKCSVFVPTFLDEKVFKKSLTISYPQDVHAAELAPYDSLTHPALINVVHWIQHDLKIVFGWAGGSICIV